MSLQRSTLLTTPSFEIFLLYFGFCNSVLSVSSPGQPFLLLKNENKTDFVRKFHMKND